MPPVPRDSRARTCSPSRSPDIGPRGSTYRSDPSWEESPMSRLWSIPLGFLALAAAVVPVSAQETASDTLLTVDHYLDWEQVADPQISPDGSQSVYTRRCVNKIADKREPALWILRADETHHRVPVKRSGTRR